MVADFVDVHDVGVLQPGGRLGLAAEPRQVLRRGVLPCQNHLEGDDAVQALLAGAIHHAHAPPAQHAQDFVPGDAPGHRGNVPGRREGGGEGEGGVGHRES